MSKKNTTNQENPLVTPMSNARKQVEDALAQAVPINVDSGFQFPLYQLREFMDAFDCVQNATPTIPDPKTALLCTKLRFSEKSETIDAMADENLLEVLDGIVDQIYVALYTARVYGLADILPAAFQLVHENNMSKLGLNGRPIKDASGKVVKPEGYVPVDLSPLLDRTNPPMPLVVKKIEDSTGICGGCGHLHCLDRPNGKTVTCSRFKAITCGQCDKLGLPSCPQYGECSPNHAPCGDYFNKGSDY